MSERPRDQRFRESVLPTLAIALAAGALLTLPAPAHGEESAEAQAAAHHQRGLDLYRAGSYAEAIEQFQQAQSIAPAPSNLFNIARCYEQLGDLTSALSHIQQYVADPALEPERRERGEQELARLQAAAAAANREPDPPDEGQDDQPPAGDGDQAAGEPEPPARRVTWTAVGEIGGGVSIALVNEALATAAVIGFDLGGGLNIGRPRQAAHGVEVRPVRLEALIGVSYQPSTAHIVEALFTGRLGVALGPLPVRVEGELAIGLGYVSGEDERIDGFSLALIPAVAVSWQVLRWLELALRPVRLELLGLASDDVEFAVRLSMDVLVRFRY